MTPSVEAGSSRKGFYVIASAERDLSFHKQARRKASLKHGGQTQRVEFADGLSWIEPPDDNLLALDEAIQLLHAEDPRLSEIVQLRYYTGLGIEETAALVGSSPSTVKRDRRFARAWLAQRLGAPAAVEPIERNDA